MTIPQLNFIYDISHMNMKWLVEFAHSRRGMVARYAIDAPSLAAAVTSAWAAVHAEHSSPPRRRPFSLFQRAQRTGGQDASGWVLDRIARTDRPASPPEA